MPVVDYIFLGMIALSVLLGFVRGFFREALSLASWVLALWLALEFGQIFVPMLAEVLPSPALQLWGARLMMFVMVLIAGAVVNRLIGMAVRKTGLSGTDRILGMGFGLGRGVLLIGLMVLGAQVLELDQEPWWEQSRIVPYGIRVADEVRDYVGEGIDYLGEEIQLGTSGEN